MRRVLLYGVLFAVLAIVAGGYATAWLSRDACIDAEWQSIAPQGLATQRFGAAARPLARDDIEARVDGPYRVEVSYLVQQGLEGTLYVRNYKALPWKREVQQREDHRINTMLR